MILGSDVRPSKQDSFTENVTIVLRTLEVKQNNHPEIFMQCNAMQMRQSNWLNYTRIQINSLACASGWRSSTKWRFRVLGFRVIRQFNSLYYDLY